MWEKVRTFIYNSRIGTISLTILLLIVGMATASLVNWISVSPIFAKSFYLGATVAVVMILLGIRLFIPFYKFRFKYLFLDKYEDRMAKYITEIKKKSENWVDSIDGIIGIRLFRVEKHTMNEDVLFNFESVFDAHSKYTKLGKLLPKQIKKPISIEKWIEKEFKTATDDAFNKLKDYYLNKYFEQILLYYLDEHIEDASEDEKEKFKEIAKVWEPRIYDYKIFKSVHYTTVFKDRKSYEVILDYKKNYFKEPIINKSHVYWEDYDEQKVVINPIGIKEGKINRRYYNLHLRIKNKNEGVCDFILQIIVDKRLIKDDEVVFSLMKNVLK